MFFVASKLDMDGFLQSFWLIESEYFLYGIIYFLVYPWFGILRWKKLVSICYQIRFLKAAKIYFFGEGLNLMLPSKLEIILNKDSELSKPSAISNNTDLDKAWKPSPTFIA